MTLIVSLRIPDGIVLAGDSLSTIESLNVLEGDVEVTCPHCQQSHTTKATLTGASIPSTSFPSAQKVFPFLESYGVGTAGAGQLNGKSIYFIMRELENELRANKKKAKIDGVSSAADIIGQRALSLLHAEAEAVGIDSAQLPIWISFQVVGYDAQTAKCIVLHVGPSVTKEEHVGSGSFVIGRFEVAKALWNIKPNETVLYDQFSLQDAIAYAEFLISATASHQRFYRELPTVGGDIDIALITPFDKFQWIRQKPLFAQLGESYAKRRGK